MLCVREEVERGDISAYEVDGYGSKYSMANIPSLLSVPVLGYMVVLAVRM